jgi:hypothetical protein
LPGHSIPVDLTAFLNLIDSQDQDFLARTLDRRRFRRLQRQRRRASLQYVRAAAHNAALLLRFAEAARLSPDAELAKSAAELASIAISVRLACLILMLKLLIPLPGTTLRIRAAGLASRYERASYTLGRVVRLQQPRLATRVCSGFLASA